ncbi:MAG TPA: hypothetical protein VEU30_00715 [Thermoanaerobaculia bacterium]|nr:hypothetical protein [Thermoanaerobaculia bacterium]
MKKLVLLAALLFSMNAFGQVLRVELTVDKSEAVTGERVGFRVRATNTASVAVGAYVQVINPEYQPIELRFTSHPDGWTCAGATSCHTSSFPANSSVEFAGFLITPTRPVADFRLVAAIQGGTAQGQEVTVRMPVLAASRSADLTVDSPASVRLGRGARVTTVFGIRNDGPDEARNLTATFGVSWDAASRVAASGPGWNCTGYVCTRASLAAGESAPITVDLTAPSDRDAFIGVSLSLFAAENTDRTGSGAITYYYVGDEASWRMMLLPVSTQPLAGANNSRWQTDLTMFLRASHEVEIEPDGCEPGAPECQWTGEPPRRVPFDPRKVWLATFGGTQFVYVRAADFENVRMNARVYDANRAAETAGAEIPIPRDDEFTSGTIALLNIPVAPEYRHTLRIYDDRGRDGTSVVIRVYAGAETEPRVTRTESLRLTQPAEFASTAQLPVHPAIAQFDLRQLLPLEGISSLRVEIEPADPAARIWSFISITNNETHHVTTVSPQ